MPLLLETIMKTVLEWQLHNQTRRVTLTGCGPHLIGRLPACHLSIPHETVAGEHAAVFVENGRLQLRNVSQTQPVLVNNHTPLACRQFVPLREGDHFRLGRIELRVVAIEQETGVVCSGCGRVVAAAADCPWCGTSLAFGIVAARQNRYDSGTISPEGQES